MEYTLTVMVPCGKMSTVYMRILLKYKYYNKLTLTHSYYNI